VSYKLLVIGSAKACALVRSEESIPASKGPSLPGMKKGINHTKVESYFLLKKNNFLDGTETVPSRFLRAVRARVWAGYKDFSISRICKFGKKSCWQISLHQ
jgi:hypothetical protein